MLEILFTIKGSTSFIQPWMISWSFSLKMLGLSADLIGHLPFWVGLLAPKQILNNYQEGMIFTDANARCYQYVGWLFLINAILIKPLSDMLMVLLATINNPPGQRIISIGCFSNANGEDIFMGSFVMIVAWVMLEANKLKEEQLLVI